jgi:hypothetical protein
MRALTHDVIAIARSRREIHHVNEIIVKPAELPIGELFVKHLSIKP